MKAHDVRYLCLCKGCHGLGDLREMPILARKPWHDNCAFKKIGVKGILKLPLSEINKFTLGAVGPKAMKIIVDKVQKAKPGTLITAVQDR